MTLVAHRGAVFHMLDETTPAYFPDGVLLVGDGKIIAADAWDAVATQLGVDVPVIENGGKLIAPGFVDTHIHFPQIDIIGSHGEQLLDWLQRYAFPAEMSFADIGHADATAEVFLDELLRNGTTTALAFGSVHRASVEALFAAAHKRNMRLIAGKVLMDRNAPDALCETAEEGYRRSKELIAAWHGKGRLGYAVTPRFAPACSADLLAMAGRLVAEHPGVLMQTHLAENEHEVAWVAELFPEANDYLDVYDRAGLLGASAVFAHCVHLDDGAWTRLAAAGAAIAFCPTSNMFLGSGLFDLASAERAGVAVGLGTDVGAGTSFSALATLNEAYKVGQLRGQSLSPLKAFYLATLGGARALGLDHVIGNFVPGKEADFIILDPAATPLLARRTAACDTLEERLFALAMMGDDRAVACTYVAGRLAHVRTD